MRAIAPVIGSKPSTNEEHARHADLRRPERRVGGAGLRLLINKRSRTNLAFDIGFGEKGNKGVCLAVQEAF